MATPDDVNAQHLASMGVSDATLGQPYSEERNLGSQEGRCDATHDGFRCARLGDHDGVHARGMLRWGSGEDDPWIDEAVDAILAEPTKQREGDQALPTPGQQCVQDLVIAEMEESKRVGLERYGSTLQTFNGRRSIQDVAEEVRDLHVYLTQVRAESETDRATLVDVVAQAIRAADGNHNMGAGALGEVAVDAIMGWVVGQRMDQEVDWGVRLVDAYFSDLAIDFKGARVPEAIQDRIKHWESQS